jgi:hypothetical protein
VARAQKLYSANALDADADFDNVRATAAAAVVVIVVVVTGTTQGRHTLHTNFIPKLYSVQRSPTRVSLTNFKKLSNANADFDNFHAAAAAVVVVVVTRMTPGRHKVDTRSTHTPH